MKMLMMMMMMSHSLAFTHFSFSCYSGLTSLPLLPPSSCLKKLDAEGCDIQSLQHDLFHHKLEEINLKENKSEDDVDVDDDDDDVDDDDTDDNDE